MKERSENAGPARRGRKQRTQALWWATANDKDHTERRI